MPEKEVRLSGLREKSGPVAKPAPGVVEMNECDFPRTLAVLAEGNRAGVFHGAVGGVWLRREPGIAFASAIGTTRAVPTRGRPVTLDTVFDLASVTKVFGTASLATVLVERGWLSWETKLGSLLPEACGGRPGAITIRHLLTHTAGLVAWEPLWQRLRARLEGARIEIPATPVDPGRLAGIGDSPERIHTFAIAERQAVMRELVCASIPEVAPGVRTLYSDLSFLLLGFCLEEVTGMPLDRAVRRFVWEPMGLEGASYRRTDRASGDARSIDENCAATELCPWRGSVLQGRVHDDNTWAMGGYAGHAGAFATVRDVLAWGASWLSGRFSASLTQECWTPLGGEGGRALGWDVPSGADPSIGRHFSRRSVGHLGFTGTSLWLDPERGIAVTLLTNRVHPSRANSAIRAFRPRFHDALAEDLLARGLF